MTEPEPNSHRPDSLATASWAVRPLLGATVAAPTAVSPLPDRPAAFASETDLPATNETDVGLPQHLPQIPDYRILRVIGNGGMGTVFKAVHIALNKVVALKLINAGWAADDEFRVRFDREAKTLAALDHENVIPVYDAGSWQGLPYLTMKFVEGKTLHHRLEEMSRDLRGTARLVAKVARAVQYLHSKGIIHRDLKPLNILLTADGTPLVADFGLVRPIDDDSDLSISLVPLGTRQYMSPEQTRGGRANYTPACDIWALGVILYELLAGQRPFAHEDTLELLSQIRSEPVPAVPAERNVPPGLEAIARKCLQKLPADRYATAETVAVDLERWLAGEPTDAPLAGPVEAPVPAKPPKSDRRGRVLLAAGAFVLLALAAVGAGLFRDRRAEALGPTDTLAVQPRLALPTVAQPTLLERFHANEKIALTDAKGKPTREPVIPKGHEVGIRTGEGYHQFFTPGFGVAELCREPFPVPYRVTATVTVLQGFQDTSQVSVFVGGREWLDGPKPYRTFVWFGIRDEQVQPVAQRVYMNGMYWSPGDLALGVIGWDDVFVPRQKPAEKNAGPHFARVEIDVRADGITGRVDGMELKSITPKTMAEQLRNEMRASAHLTPPYTYTPPYFGSGIGIFVRNADGVVADLTVTKLVP